MRIVHAVTLVSGSGAYGGPVSVATGQLRALADRGHDVTLVALWGGKEAPPNSYEGLRLVSSRARCFIPGTGFLGLFNVGYPLRLWRVIGAADVVHIHTGRDLTSIAALVTAAIRRKATFVQTHGMVSIRAGLAARTFDVLLRPLLRRATACFVLTDTERSELKGVLRYVGPPMVDLPNGVQLSKSLPAKDNENQTVIYLARLHERKRPLAFVMMAAAATAAVPRARFLMYGPDEGALTAVTDEIERLGLGGIVEYRGAVAHQEAIRIIQAAQVYVLPSVDEPFPMSVLEALAVGTAVVCTNSTGISTVLALRGAAAVTDGSAAAMASSVVELLQNHDERNCLVEQGRLAVTEVFSIATVVTELETRYRQATVQ